MRFVLILWNCMEVFFGVVLFDLWVISRSKDTRVMWRALRAFRLQYLRSWFSLIWSEAADSIRRPQGRPRAQLTGFYRKIQRNSKFKRNQWYYNTMLKKIESTRLLLNTHWSSYVHRSSEKKKISSTHTLLFFIYTEKFYWIV